MLEQYLILSDEQQVSTTFQPNYLYSIRFSIYLFHHWTQFTNLPSKLRDTLYNHTRNVHTQHFDDTPGADIAIKIKFFTIVVSP